MVLKWYRIVEQSERFFVQALGEASGMTSRYEHNWRGMKMFWNRAIWRSSSPVTKRFEGWTVARLSSRRGYSVTLRPSADVVAFSFPVTRTLGVARYIKMRFDRS